MKVHRISIGSYQQIKSLELDLTYPKGHPKAGQALDRVCFIGQGGTGKTTLLRLIKYFITHDPNMGNDLQVDEYEARTIRVDMMIGKHFVRKHRRAAGFFAASLKKGAGYSWDADFREYYLQHIIDNRPILLNFPVEAPRNILIKEYPEYSMHNIYGASEYDTYELPEMGSRDFVDFGDRNSIAVWDLVMDRIKRHTSQELYWKQKIAEAAIAATRTSQKKVEQLTGEYEAWLKLNPNPLEDLAAKLNSLIAPLGVRIKTNVDHQMIMRLGSLQLQTHQGIDLNREFWSTGTRQIIETAVPMIESKAKGAIVLIDEPEKSLYPDVQSQIVDFYSGLVTDSQFFYATHSPIIASSFDPWEIVELKFDESNQYVVQETNYEGERHVDNYTVYPKYLRWDRILMSLFDLKEEGNSQERDKVLLEIIALRTALNEMKATGKNDGPEYAEKAERFLRLRKMVGWDEKAG